MASTLFPRHARPLVFEALQDTRARVHHYRDGRDEIDVVLESRSGEIAAVEVKA